MTAARKELSPYVPENKILRDDYDKCLSALAHYENEGFFRRMLFRSAFAYIEGILYQFKLSTAGLTLAQHFQAARREKPYSVMPSPYVGFLTETDFILTDAGEIRETRALIKLKTNIQYTFKQAASTYRSAYQLDKGAGWHCFLRSIKVRDRITHPKDPSDMAITNVEVKDVQEAVVWFDKAVGDLLDHSDFKAFLLSLTGPKAQPRRKKGSASN
jgi:hypothetical protein